ncbi:MAG: phosphatidate cytidylyltransferase [Oscillospiraceae bacterium]|nr:phosphatidate cytidylyltransferase [Oscillospiraceae bacterium]
MKIRIITGLMLAAMAIIALWNLMTPMIGLLIIPFAALAAYEVLHVARVKSKPMIVLGISVAAVISPLIEYQVLQKLRIPMVLVLMVYAFTLCVMMLCSKEKKFSDVLMTMLGSLSIPAAMSSVTLIRDSIHQHELADFEQNLAIFFLFFTFCCAWLTDSFAFFVGVKFGKHKLCPDISPKKTVEGALGGILCTALVNMGFALMFNAFFLDIFRIRIWAVGIISLPICVVSIIGDLTASIIKRNYGVKDYGKLFPGHGGVMDRFDSLLFVAPFVYLLIETMFRLNVEAFYFVR